ncbi:AraC family transcriptional regulator [Paraburkholderia fungorum]
MLSPCRCNSRIVITSPSSTTGSSPTNAKAYMVGDRRGATAYAAAPNKKTGEIYFDENEEYLSDADISVAAVTADLLDAWVRMLRLMTHPADIPALAPAYEREILYRVLQGPMGWMLHDIATPDTALSRINRIIQRIRRDYALPLRMHELAEEAAMSVSAFHRHFKAVTALSPLQYQKQIRLLQARTRLITAGHSVTTAAHEVGYESPTQFSREYARAFGLPPAKDAARIIAGLRSGLRR